MIGRFIGREPLDKWQSLALDTQRILDALEESASSSGRRVDL